MGWLFVGAVIGVTIGMFLMAAVSITRMRDTQAVADAAVAYFTDWTPGRWQDLTRAVDRLVAE